MPSAYPYIAAFIILQLTSMLVSSSPLRRALFLSMAAICIYIILCTTTGSPADDYFTGLPLSISLCNASTLILLSDPQYTAFRQGQTAAAHALPFKQRLLWATDIITNWRGINWSFEIPGVRRSNAPRLSYVISRLKWCFFHYILYDAATLINQNNPAFWKDGERMGQRGVAYQAFNVLMFWTTFASSMAMKHSLFSAITVALHLYEPRDWPFPFGPLLHTTTVRTFWGRTWHQALRHPVSSHGKYLAQTIFRFSLGTSLSSYTQLYTAFLLSGIFHAAGDWMMSHNLQRFIDVTWYFVIQAVAISVEDLVIAIAKKFGIRQASFLSSAAGMVWVFCWTVWSGPLWMETMIRGGAMEDGPPLSVVGRLPGLAKFRT
ncbi:membrane bound O-acyl transferase family-domain-containing protein [Collybia nuda]|uniref:Membrane bound O-acyl transferase family-domain-containing protein n=1 Tax=Collybia nuda TaxID=64659 RepID=A0A9P5XR44_9AGAR|nr:membrane bound O-acyl transferase family-domain-containing protein [Collybia nuda]